ncbi:hypothetical protein PR003_g4360 [Phytophthora rubi]|uniref:Uncharacterized protein n=1 Tax=Phytophthora rubi TaxID=129364 RepID=A0A6A4FV87_9STRA|nr:hypothetical protein PR003_g4360 [Phytophthora rubi]
MAFEIGESPAYFRISSFSQKFSGSFPLTIQSIHPSAALA